MKLHQLAVATMIASASMAAHAEFTVSPMIGYTFYDREDNVRDDMSGSIALGYRVTPNVGVELRYGQGRSKDDATKTEKTRNQVGTLDAYYRFNADGALQPYVLVGGGQTHLKVYDGVTNESRRSTVANAALGAFYQLSDSLALRGEARVIENLQQNLHDTVVSLGVTYGFGAQKAAVVAPAVIAAPAPAPAKPAPKVLTETVTRDLRVLFDTNKSIVKPEFKGEIAEVAKLMQEYPTAKVEIQGHTDSTGSDRINNPLSQARADAVAAVLISEFGIDRDRITAKGYGSSQPVADNATAEGRAKNRRTVAQAEAEVKVTVKQ